MFCYSACAACPGEEARMSCTCMQEQELAALRAEVTALKRVQRPSAAIEPAQDASQTRVQHPPPQNDSGNQQRSIRNSAPPALGVPSQDTTTCRPQGLPGGVAAAPPAKAQESASGAANAAVSSQPVPLQLSCASKHAVLGKRDISGGLRSRQEELLQPAADTADELEVELCDSVSDIICRSIISAKTTVTVQVWDAAYALS